VTPYREPCQPRGPSIDEASSTPWWHLLRRWRGKRRKRDEARKWRERKALRQQLLEMTYAGLREAACEMGVEAATIGIAMREVTRPAPTEKPGRGRRAAM
jgi:hypothetical protein